VPPFHRSHDGYFDLAIIIARRDRALALSPGLHLLGLAPELQGRIVATPEGRNKKCKMFSN